MAEERNQRRLADILAADVVGYSKLMGLDESGTLSAFKAHRRELVDGKIAEQQGRIVKLTGDGMLCEFASVVNAVTSAMAIQQALAEHEAETPEEERIRFRIGVNLGDVIVEVDRQPIRNPADMHRQLDEHTKGTPVLMLVHRGEGSLFVTVDA
jgi:class 3 adenylate cyclase